MTKYADMTEGGIVKQLYRFMIPMFLGNLLQNLYNAFDAIVVGNYVGSDALAAVGASGPFVNMIIAFFIGMSNGAGVLISQAFGARDDEDMRGLIHTSVSLAALLGVGLSVIGFAITPAVLRIMRTPDQIVPDSVVYLRVYFAGLTGLTLYNIGAAVFTAVGDTRRPLYYLIISSFIKIACSILAVRVLNLGIAGVAYSTVLAQIVTSVLVITALCRADGPHKLNLRSLRITRPYAMRIFNIGLPGGIQTSIISASNIIVQSYINRLGAAVVAGYSVTTRLDAFVMMPVQTMSIAITTFVGQNLGAGKVKRARQGVTTAVVGGLVMTAAVSAAELVFGAQLLRVFTPEADIIENGLRFIRVFAPLYFILCFSQVIPGALRGAGDVRMSMFTCVGSFVGLRQLYLLIMTNISYTPETVALGYPLTWAIAGAILTIYYIKQDWRRFGRPNFT